MSQLYKFMTGHESSESSCVSDIDKERSDLILSLNSEYKFSELEALSNSA